jgi:hypothetical protein
VDVGEAHAALVAGLNRLRNTDGGWPYYAGRTSRLEPTCWALLGTATAPDSTPLASWTQAGGLLVEPATGQVNYTFNALAGLTFSAAAATATPVTAGIVDAIAAATPVVTPPAPAIRQDTSLHGWSWTPGTVSWIEPTAWCLLLVKKWPHSAAASARIDEAERVLRDRACAGGGWNFGNGEVYGQGLPAHAPPTAAGLLAMQDHRADRLVSDATGWLEREAPREGSTTALALAAIALMILGRPVHGLIEALAARLPETLAFGNLAAMGMAACALDAAMHDRPAPAFVLSEARR